MSQSKWTVSATTPAYVCLQMLKLLTDKLRRVRVPVERLLKSPDHLVFSPSYARNSLRNFEKSLLNSDIGDFINYFNFGKKIAQKRTVDIKLLDEFLLPFWVWLMGNWLIFIVAEKKMNAPWKVKHTHTFYPQYNLSISLRVLKFNNKIGVTLQNFYFMCFIPNFLMF